MGVLGVTAGELIEALSKVPPERVVEIHYSGVYTDEVYVYDLDHPNFAFASVCIGTNDTEIRHNPHAQDLTVRTPDVPKEGS